MTTTGRGIPPVPVNDPDDAGRARHLLLFIEFAAIVAVFLGDRYLPVSKTPYLFALAWISLRLRGLRWRDVGFVRPRNWPRALALGVICGVAMEAFELFASQPLLIRITGHKPDFSEFFVLRGNFKLLLVALALSWTLAAFGEEMVWRGYLMNRGAGVIGQSRAAWMISLIVVNAGFGLAHRYQGITGILDEALMGLFSA